MIDNTSSEEVIEKRFRHFVMILYPEWNNCDEIIQDIKGSFKKYAYILHTPEANEKKLHYHFILSLDNPRTIESLSKRLGIPKNLIQNCRSLRGACRYLIHKDNDDKIQYNLDQVICSKSFSNTYYKSFDDLLSDNEILQNIYDFIYRNSNIDSVDLEVLLTNYVCINNFDRIFKKYYNTIIKVIAKVSL